MFPRLRRCWRLGETNHPYRPLAVPSQALDVVARTRYESLGIQHLIVAAIPGLSQERFCQTCKTYPRTSNPVLTTGRMQFSTALQHFGAVFPEQDEQFLFDVFAQSTDDGELKYSGVLGGCLKKDDAKLLGRISPWHGCPLRPRYHRPPLGCVVKKGGPRIRQ